MYIILGNVVRELPYLTSITRSPSLPMIDKSLIKILESFVSNH